MSERVPKLRFKRDDGAEFPEWEYIEFGNVFDFYRTNSLSRAQLLYDRGNVQNIHYGDIHTKFSARFKQQHEIIPYINESETTYSFPEDEYCRVGDLVIADASEDYKDIGKAIEIVSKTETLLVAGLHTFLARPKESTFAVGFTGYMMQAASMREKIMRLAQGISVLGISKTQLIKVVISKPCLEEQQKIASFLSAVDEKIGHLERRLELLRTYKRGVMQKLFSQEVRFKREDCSAFPDWEDEVLGSLCQIAKSGGTPSATNREYYGGNIPFLSISDMTQQGKYLRYTKRTITQKGLDNSSAWIVPSESLIYSMYASVGFVSINKIPIATSQAVMNLILKRHVCQEYVYYYLVKFQEKVHRFIETGTQGNLNAQIVKYLPIILPSVEEQQKIASFLSALDSKLDAVSKQISQMQRFKKGLLQQMFV